MLTQKDFPIHKYWLIKPILGQVLYIAIIFTAIRISSQPLLIPLPWVASFLVLLMLQLLSRPIITTFTLKFELRDEALWLQQGFFTRKQGNFYYHKIQDAAIIQGFVDRLLNVYTVSVENAGVSVGRTWVYTNLLVGLSDNRVSIPGLGKAQAETLRQEILNRMKARASDASGV